MDTDEVMTAEEINSSFDAEWVLVADPETDANLVVKRGRVIWHGKDKADMHRKMAEPDTPRYLAVLYTGRMPKDMVIII